MSDFSPDSSHASNKANPREWLIERASIAAATPFALWFIMATLRVDTMTRTQYMNWAGKPLNATFILAFVIAATAHARLGLDNIIDDYSRGTWHKIFRILNRLILGTGLLLTVRTLWRFYKFHKANKHSHSS